MNRKSLRNIWVDYLRSSITVLVIAHHASLAYTTFSTFNKDAYILSTHGVVDRSRWAFLDYLVGFNDTFFMSLMFFLGGLFFFPSIRKKGSLLFVKDKVYRLLIPFLVLGTLFMLIAYFPSFYLAKNNTDIGLYVHDFFTTESWPVGPPWFLWLLFVFNCLAALIYKLLPSNVSLSNFSWSNTSAFKLFSIFFLIGIFAYLPMANYYGPYSWTGFGPFDFQLSRLFLYFAYFGMGATIGKSDQDHLVFSKNSSTVKYYRLWCFLAVVAFAGLILSVDFLNLLKDEKILSGNQSATISNLLLVLCCTLTSIAFISTFCRLTIRKISWWDSLSKHAYLIYLVHFVYITWIQFYLLDLNIHAGFKFIITFLLALALSWGTAYLLRKITLIKTYL